MSNGVRRAYSGSMLTDETKLRRILDFDRRLNQIQDLDILLETILREARDAVSADAGTIYVAQGRELAIKYAQNDTLSRALAPGEKLIYSVFKIGINKKTIAGYAAATQEILNIPDVYSLPEEKDYTFDPAYDRLAGYTTRSVLAIPLVTNFGVLAGVLQLINARDGEGGIRPFNEEDQLFARHFAGNATMAIQRAQMTRTLLLRMIGMAELRDPKETGAHVNRVAGYAVEIYDGWAVRNGVPDKERVRNRDILRMAAMLHDVGKVAISDMILKKPGRFTDDEYKLMKSHTWLGADLFGNQQSDFDQVAAEVARSHHERWDGTGYPKGLKGGEIPLFGRIVSLADVYDALCSRRVYKEAWDEEAVLQEIREERGRKFDPQVTDIFLAVYNNIKQVASLYPE